jgi:hypothetical protein
MTGWFCFFAWILSLGDATPAGVTVLIFLAMMNEILD